MQFNRKKSKAVESGWKLPRPVYVSTLPRTTTQIYRGVAKYGGRSLPQRRSVVLQMADFFLFKEATSHRTITRRLISITSRATPSSRVVCVFEWVPAGHRPCWNEFFVKRAASILGLPLMEPNYRRCDRALTCNNWPISLGQPFVFLHRRSSRRGFFNTSIRQGLRMRFVSKSVSGQHDQIQLLELGFEKVANTFEGIHDTWE